MSILKNLHVQNISLKKALGWTIVNGLCMSYTSSDIEDIELSDLIKVTYYHQGSMVLKIKSKKQVNFTGNFISTFDKHTSF